MDKDTTRLSSGRHLITAIIKMYAKCGCMPEARRAFDRMRNPDLVALTVLLMGYAENGEGRAALEMFSSRAGYAADSFTYVALLKACTSLAVKGEHGDALKWGREIHSKIGRHSNVYVTNTLIDMYAKCGSMFDARRAFDNANNADIVSWNSLLWGYAENGQSQVTLDLFARMRAAQRFVPNPVTYSAVLKACVGLAVSGGRMDALKWGREIHADIRNSLDPHLQSALVNLYAKCGDMVSAKRMFESIQDPDAVSCTAMLLCYVENGHEHAALSLFSKMKQRHALDSVAYFAALKACTALALNGDKDDGFKRGSEIHSEIGCHVDSLYINNTLIDMYSKCSKMEYAREVFEGIHKPDIVSWNALILGYAENGEGLLALELFAKMKAEHACAPDTVMYVSVLKACTSLAVSGKKDEGFQWGRVIHSEVLARFPDDLYVQNTLVYMYSKCGAMDQASCVFDSIQKPDVVSWTALISGYAENGEGQIALELFSRMKPAPNALTYAAALKACGLVGALALGRKVHSAIDLANEAKSDGVSEISPYVVTCIVDFYAKCGSVADACEVFDQYPRLRRACAWTALLVASSRFGDHRFVINCFDALTSVGFQPDSVTLLCVLTCCSHSGMVDKARWYLNEMASLRYGSISPDVRHYTCMVDGLCRSKQLREAAALIQGMSCKPDAVTWMTLLAACHKWKNMELAQLAFRSLVEMDKTNAAAYVLMADIYRASKMLPT